MLYSIKDQSYPVMNVSREPNNELNKDAILTLIIPLGKLHSFEHKFGRIQKQEAFEKEKENQFKSLTKREREIIALLVDGFSSQNIAESLFISRYTVEQHRKNIYRKLEIQSIVDLMQYALAFNLI